MIRRFRKMMAINSALSIDLTGQVSADSIGTRFYSGVGGQMDFMRGAALAPEGRAIIALPSAAAGGTISRIAPFLAEGAGVVTSRAHVRTVVTEYGVAELFGQSVREPRHSLRPRIPTFETSWPARRAASIRSDAWSGPGAG